MTLLTREVALPLKNYRVNGLAFGRRAEYDGKLWGIHLGEDVRVPAGTDVFAIGDGEVAYAGLHAGSRERRNWGHIAILRHCDPATRRPFYSLYGHLGEVYKRIGETVRLGEPLGFVGKSLSRENGYWSAHLHFAIYTGPWNDKVLPGYWRQNDRNTRPEWWHRPTEFIENYGRAEKPAAHHIPIRGL